MAVRIDISSELSVIAIEPYGDAVKTAVHDAIQKVNGSGGESKNDGPRKIDRLFDTIKADGSANALILANDILAACAPGIAVEELDPMNVNLKRLTWENRFGNDDTGEFYGNPSNRIVCVDYIEIPETGEYTAITMFGSADSYYSYAYYYDSSYQYLGLTATHQTNSGSDYILPGAKYVRFGFRRSDSADVSYDEFYTCDLKFSADQTKQTHDMTSLTWENRNGNDNTGEFFGNPANRLVCESYVPIPSGCTQVSIAIFALDTLYDKYIYYYDSDKQYLGIASYIDWTTTSTECAIYQGAAYVRFGFRRHDNGNLNHQTVKSCSAIFS